MTALCPSGHESQTTDWCDQCGARISDGATGGHGATQVLPAAEELETSPSARREPCPACGEARTDDDRYCEGCGYDFLSPPPATTTWEAIVSADRAQFDRLAAAGVEFPADYAERRFALAEGENRIGRSRDQRGEDAPEIDLAAPPVDPGLSRLHAVLEHRTDGACVLRDLGSTNGTTLGDALAPIAAHTDVPLADGDRVRVGAWTTITVRRR